MLTTFTLLVAFGLGLRLALSTALRRRFSRELDLPSALGCALVILASLPDWLKPIPFPFPVGLTLGAVLPDLLSKRG